MNQQPKSKGQHEEIYPGKPALGPSRPRTVALITDRHLIEG